MEIKEADFEAVITKNENLIKTIGDLIHTQQVRFTHINGALNPLQDRLTTEFLDLARVLNKNKLNTYATRIEGQVVKYLLSAPYDARSTFAIHKALFAERHTMAMFLYDNLAEIKEHAFQHIKKNESQSAGKMKVFTYWDNDDKLPPIVALCRESLKKHIPDDKFELIILNSDTYKNWTDFRKEDIKANISQAHFTDILRVKLLEQWGGFWIDATDMLTGNFYQTTQQIREQDQFLFTYANSRTGTWFMYSKVNNYIISMLSKSISLWWEKKSYLTNYFMLHDIIEMLYWLDTDYRNAWDDMVKIHPKNALAILQGYNQTLTQEKFTQLLANSFVHKLTYKYDAEKILPNSVLAHLLSLKL